MGIHVEVFRWNLGDCTAHGVSSDHDTLTVVNAEGPFDPSPDAPAVLLESHVRGCLRIVPAVNAGTDEHPLWVPKHGWAMAGGNYGATSDSRFSELAEKLLGHRFYGAVNIHDRYEGK